jgi:hypothetical protein
MTDQAPQTFEEYVAAWSTLRGQIQDNKQAMAATVAKELEMRKAITEALDKAIPGLKEGVNKYPVAGVGVLSYTRKLKREVDETQIAVARAAFVALNTEQPIMFDEMLRTKYELDKKNWDKLDEDAKRAVSTMITTTPSTPELELK